MNFGPSWAEREAAANTPQKQISLALEKLSLNDSYDAFVLIIEDAVKFSISHLVKQKNVIAGKGGNKPLDEDQLTFALSSVLTGLGFSVSFSKNVGGNCDLIIEGPNDYIWIAEAKIFSSYSKLLGGFRQLCDRYSTGLRTHSKGALIIYMFGEKVKSMMSEWSNYLIETRKGIVIDMIDEDNLTFRSTEPHRATEIEIQTKHIAVPLLHQPTDVQKAPRRTRYAKKTIKPESV